MAKSGTVQGTGERESEANSEFNYPFPEKDYQSNSKWNDVSLWYEWTKLTSSLERNSPGITKLNLTKISGTSLRDLATALTKCTNAQELILSKVKGSWLEYTDEWAPGLKAISRVDISSNHLTLKAIGSILNFLSSFPQLKDLVLADNRYLFDDYEHSKHAEHLRKFATKLKTLNSLDLSKIIIDSGCISILLSTIPPHLTLKGITLHGAGLENLVMCLKLAKPGSIVDLQEITVDPASDYDLLADLCQRDQSLTLNLCPKAISQSEKIKQLAQQRNEMIRSGFVKTIFDEIDLSNVVNQFCTSENGEVTIPAINKLDEDCAEFGKILNGYTKKYGHYKFKLLNAPEDDITSVSQQEIHTTSTSDEVSLIDPAAPTSDH